MTPEADGFNVPLEGSAMQGANGLYSEKVSTRSG